MANKILMCKLLLLLPYILFFKSKYSDSEAKSSWARSANIDAELESTRSFIILPKNFTIDKLVHFPIAPCEEVDKDLRQNNNWFDSKIEINVNYSPILDTFDVQANSNRLQCYLVRSNSQARSGEPSSSYSYGPCACGDGGAASLTFQRKKRSLSKSMYCALLRFKYLKDGTERRITHRYVKLHIKLKVKARVAGCKREASIDKPTIYPT